MTKHNYFINSLIAASCHFELCDKPKQHTVSLPYVGR